METDKTQQLAEVYHNLNQRDIEALLADAIWLHRDSVNQIRDLIKTVAGVVGDA